MVAAAKVVVCVIFVALASVLAYAESSGMELPRIRPTTDSFRMPAVPPSQHHLLLSGGVFGSSELIFYKTKNAFRLFRPSGESIEITGGLLDYAAVKLSESKSR